MVKKVRITDGFILRKLKYKWTLPMFANHFNVSEKEFSQILIREFGEKIGEGFLKSMEENKETAQKNLKRKAGKTNKNNSTLEEKHMPDKSAELNNKRNEFLKKIESVCLKITADNTEIEKIGKQIGEEFKAYEQILEDVRRREQRIEQLIEQKNTLAGRISENKTQEENLRAELKKVDDEIFKLSYIKVNCGIFESSETFDMLESDFEITSDELRRKFHELIDNEATDLFEDLSMKQMAKVQLYMIIIQRVTEMGKKCKLYFPVDDNVTTALSLLTEDVVVVVEI